MLDLRGLISLDNKTKRVNVLIVADGAGILGKCVKLVLTSGSHSSPPCCDLLLTSLCCSLHPSHSIPRSSHIHFSIPLVTLSLVSLLYIHTQQVRETGLNGMQEKGREWCKLFIHIWIPMKTGFGLQSNKIGTSTFMCA